jgi:hypothetical protein
MRHALAVLAALIFPACLAAQSLEQRVTRVGTGTVHLSFPARPGVCGSANGINIDDDDGDWEHDCSPEQVLVSLRLNAGKVAAVSTNVGGRWRPGTTATDLGAVRPQEAAAYFLSLAERAGDLEGDPVLPAALADSVTLWPSLLKLARNRAVPEESRRTAVFWLGQAASDDAGNALDTIAGDVKEDREIRKQAVFALSQRESDGVPALIRIARTNPDPELRRTAIFWLGQTEDPRAIELFEEILR